MNISYLKLDTNEPYQPIRLTYKIYNLAKLQQGLSKLSCLEQHLHRYWLWRRAGEAKDIMLLGEIADSSKQELTIELGVFDIKNNDKFVGHFQSLERAYLWVIHANQWLDKSFLELQYADLVNFLFPFNYKKQELFDDLFNDELLQNASEQQQAQWQSFNNNVSNFVDRNKLIESLINYADQKNKEPLPNTERYLLNMEELGMGDKVTQRLIFIHALLLRQLAAVHQWEGKADYNINSALAEVAKNQDDKFISSLIN